MGALADMRAGLAANLAVIEDVQVTAYMLSAPTPPTLEVFPDEVVYDQAMNRGLDEWAFIVRAYVGLTTDVGAQVLLDRMLEPAGGSSVKAAVEAEPTLGGAAEDLRVMSATGYRVYVGDGRPAVLGCEWTVSVIAAGD